MSREHTFVDDPVVVVPRPAGRRELERQAWARFTVRPWHDAAVEEGGHRFDSFYVEKFWLPIVGPTGILTARNLARRVSGASVDLDELAAEMGCKAQAMSHTLSRLERFSFITSQAGSPTVFVRRHVAPLPLTLFGQLPAHLRVEHSMFVEPDRG